MVYKKLYPKFNILPKTFAVSTAINDLVDLCTNLLCNKSKATFYLGAIFFYFDICFNFLINACFRCAICGKVAAFLSLLPNYIVQNHLLNKQVCPEFINVII